MLSNQVYGLDIIPLVIFERKADKFIKQNYNFNVKRFHCNYKNIEAP